MRPLYHFIVQVPERVKETKKIGDVEIYIETKFNEFEHRVMEGVVVGVPEKYNTGVEDGRYAVLPPPRCDHPTARR
jgi:hypothetical protein